LSLVEEAYTGTIIAGESLIQAFVEMNSQDPTNEEPAAGLAAYDYGYEECAPAVTGEKFPYTEMGSPVSQYQDLEYQDLAESCSMPADRLARKQRSFSRRGGAGHSLLLKSAVLAAMETQEDSSDDENDIRVGRARRDSLVSFQACMPPNWKDGPTSPRKRARLFTGGSSSAQVSDDEVASASQLLSAMCTGDEGKVVNEPIRGVPRRTSRRTSYGSKISDRSDGELPSD
jgi:hypothetical protein